MSAECRMCIVHSASADLVSHCASPGCRSLRDAEPPPARDPDPCARPHAARSTAAGSAAAPAAGALSSDLCAALSPSVF
eukprot:290402-Prymnesium_polylepis.1